jgi:hypothetical protein
VQVVNYGQLTVGSGNGVEFQFKSQPQNFINQGTVEVS